MISCLNVSDNKSCFPLAENETFLFLSCPTSTYKLHDTQQLTHANFGEKMNFFVLFAFADTAKKAKLLSIRCYAKNGVQMNAKNATNVSSARTTFFVSDVNHFSCVTFVPVRNSFHSCLVVCQVAMRFSSVFSPLYHVTNVNFHANEICGVSTSTEMFLFSHSKKNGLSNADAFGRWNKWLGRSAETVRFLSSLESHCPSSWASSLGCEFACLCIEHQTLFRLHSIQIIIIASSKNGGFAEPMIEPNR